MSDKKAVMTLQEQIKQQVAQLQESMGDKTITIDKRSGTFRVGITEGTDSISVVILAFAFQGAFWSKAYKQGQTDLPDCSVTGDIDTKYADSAVPPYVGAFTDLKPHGKDEETPPEAEVCGECPNNIFGSGATGSGKACKQSYTLAVLPAGDPGGHIHKVKISASGMRYFNDYLKNLGSAGTVWWANATTLKVMEAGSSWSIKTESDNVTKLPDAQLEAFYKRIPEAKAMLEYRAPEAPAKEVAAGGKA